MRHTATRCATCAGCAYLGKGRATFPAPRTRGRVPGAVLGRMLRDNQRHQRGPVARGLAPHHSPHRFVRRPSQGRVRRNPQTDAQAALAGLAARTRTSGRSRGPGYVRSSSGRACRMTWAGMLSNSLRSSRSMCPQPVVARPTYGVTVRNRRLRGRRMGGPCLFSGCEPVVVVGHPLRLVRHWLSMQPLSGPVCTPCCGSWTSAATNWRWVDRGWPVRLRRPPCVRRRVASHQTDRRPSTGWMWNGSAQFGSPRVMMRPWIWSNSSSKMDRVAALHEIQRHIVRELYHGERSVIGGLRQPLRSQVGPSKMSSSTSTAPRARCTWATARRRGLAVVGRPGSSAPTPACQTVKLLLRMVAASSYGRGSFPIAASRDE